MYLSTVHAFSNVVISLALETGHILCIKQTFSSSSYITLGTGFEGGVGAMYGGLCIAMHKMDQIVKV